MIDSVGDADTGNGDSAANGDLAEIVDALTKRADKLKPNLSDRQWQTIQQLIADVDTEENARVVDQTLDMLAPYETPPEPPKPPPEHFDKSLTPAIKMPKISATLADRLVASGFPTATEIVAALRGDVGPLRKVTGLGPGKIKAFTEWADKHMPVTEPASEPCAWCEDSGESCACNDGKASEGGTEPVTGETVPEPAVDAADTSDGNTDGKAPVAGMVVLSEELGPEICESFLDGIDDGPVKTPESAPGPEQASAAPGGGSEHAEAPEADTDPGRL